jgi:anti-sigma B factor antagonist
VSCLEASVAAGASGPVIVLSGETEFMAVGQLSALISAQLSAGTRQLTIDMAGLQFADQPSIRALVLAARTLTERGGSLVLLRPQRQVAKALAVMGVERMFTIRGEIATPKRRGSAEGGVELRARRPTDD